jgi:hypothetical protein
MMINKYIPKNILPSWARVFGFDRKNFPCSYNSRNFKYRFYNSLLNNKWQNKKKDYLNPM